MAKTRTVLEEMPPRSPDRKQFLVHIDANLIRRVKILALDREVTASSLVQAAIVDMLAKNDAVKAQD